MIIPKGSGGGGRPGRTGGGGGGIEGTGIQSIEDATADMKARIEKQYGSAKGVNAENMALANAAGTVAIDGDRIVVRTPRKNEISEHVKSLGYKYSTGEWSKKVSSLSEAHSELKKLGSKKGLVEYNKGDIKEVMQSRD